MTIGCKTLIRSFATFLFILSALVCCSAQTKKSKHQRWNWQKHQAEVIDYAKKYSVSAIEPGMPQQISFEKWFQSMVGEETKVDWDVNDCGEQTGTSADRGRDFPMCVEARALKPQFIETSINIQFGTFKQGITEMKPVVRSIVAGDDIGSEWVNNLSDLPEILKLQEKTRQYLNPNRGSFRLSDDPPAGFEKFHEMWLHTVEYDKTGKGIPITANGGMLIGETFYKVSGFYTDRKAWRLETVKIGGVSFKFEGQFAKLNFDSGGFVSTRNVLQGHLIKLVNGKKAAEADLIFSFYATGDDV